MIAERLKDKVCLVTGAGSGIGAATALRLAQEGADVALFDVNEEGLATTAKTVTDLGRSALTQLCDVSSEVAVKSGVAAVVARLGKLDVLCNVAGFLRTGHTHEQSLEGFQRLLAVNLQGTFLMTREVLPELLKKKGRNIVNVASTAALGGHPWMSAYAASKGGVLSFTRATALEYVRQGIRINAVIPGGIATPIHSSFELPEGADGELLRGAIGWVRHAGPEYVASVIAFLASDDARYMTGAELRVDGGAMT